MHEKCRSTAPFILNVGLYGGEESDTQTPPFTEGEQTPLCVKNNLDVFEQPIGPKSSVAQPILWSL
jgi:hypothetical protein